jgi:hypothetical protein
MVQHNARHRDIDTHYVVGADDGVKGESVIGTVGGFHLEVLLKV